MKWIFAALFVGLTASAAAQSPTESPPQAKDPERAATLGFIPGFGHYYAGEPGKGTLLLLGFGLSAYAVTHPLPKECAQGESCKTEALGSAGPVVYTALGIFCWGYSIIDARKAAVRFNDRYGVHASITPGPNGATRVGLAVAF